MFGQPLTGGFCRPDRGFDERAICQQTHRWTLFEAHDEPFEIAAPRLTQFKVSSQRRMRGFVARELTI